MIIILSSILLKKSSLPAEKFDKCTGLIIALFVFDCIAALNSLLNAINGNYYAILTLLVYAMCAVFIMLDLCFNKKALKNAAGDVKASKTSNNIGKPSLQQTLSELKEMKDAGIISEEEYRKLREKLIDNYEF